MAARKKRILIIEDQADARAMFRVLLEAEGYEVAEAGDLSSGLAEALQSPPDLIVTDIVMPGGSGFQAVAEMRSRESLARVPILVCSARVNDEDRDQVLALGANDYIAKPFDNSRFRAKVKRLLDGGAQHGR